MPTTLPTLEARSYLQPLREGGSLPAVLETDGGMFVTKFRGAGQGPRALIAELVVALLALELGLPVPEPAVITLPDGFGADQGDPEIRELLEASAGPDIVNMGLRYMDGAFNYDPAAAEEFMDPETAAAVVWLDAYVTNPDRTARNPNLMVWERRPWLIDHGTALYAHHSWGSVTRERTRAAFPMIRDHVLLPVAGDLEAADARLAPTLEAETLAAILDAVPDALLMDPLARGPFDRADQARERYTRWLAERLEPPRAFVADAVRAREERRDRPPERKAVRR